MCDFRAPPTGIQDVVTNECKQVNYLGCVNTDKVLKVTLPGRYHIACTGSYYAYFDGNRWWSDINDWRPSKYRFIFTSDNCQKRLLNDVKDWFHPPVEVIQ